MQRLCECGCGEVTAPGKRFIQYHHHRARPPMSAEDRLKRSQPREKNPNWLGGRIRTPRGYIRVNVGTDHPMADKRGEAYEHRLVMADNLGRLLKRHEHVHHLDGDKSNNSPDNLALMESSEHKGLHWRGDGNPRRRRFSPCGTRAKYNRGCRCDSCREAQMSAQREYRQRQRL